jgi:hypothetical protein
MAHQRDWSWRWVKTLRARTVGYRCEICGSREGGLVGHHLLSRKEWLASLQVAPALIKRAGCEEIVVRLCRLRCRACESAAHCRFPDGNSPSEAKEAARLRALLARIAVVAAD